MAKCGLKTEVFSRVCGYFRPIANWNRGKRAEFKDGKILMYAVKRLMWLKTCIQISKIRPKRSYKFA